MRVWTRFLVYLMPQHEPRSTRVAGLGLGEFENKWHVLYSDQESAGSSNVKLISVCKTPLKYLEQLLKKPSTKHS